MKTTTCFTPAWWLSNRHLQTLWPTLFRRQNKNLLLRRERIELPDGDFIDLDWTTESGPLVLILPGLEGSITSPYATGMLQAMQQHGWQGVFMHFRGCSGEHNRLARGYHAGDTEDVAYIVNVLQQRFANTPIAAIGFSLGGNVLLKWLGETGEKNPLIAAVAVSVPFDLYSSVQAISKGFGRIYQWYLLRSLQQKTQDKLKVHPDLPAVDLADIKSLYDFDDKITAPLHGFSNALAYYDYASCRQYLPGIRVPTLLLQAGDDPFATTDSIPQPEELSRCTQLELTARGGHVGFIASTGLWQTRYWLEERIPQFLGARLGNN